MNSVVVSKYGYRIIPMKLTRKADANIDYANIPYPTVAPYFGEVGGAAFYRYKNDGSSSDERAFDKIIGEDSNITPGRYTIKNATTGSSDPVTKKYSADTHTGRSIKSCCGK